MILINTLVVIYILLLEQRKKLRGIAAKIRFFSAFYEYPSKKMTYLSFRRTISVNAINDCDLLTVLCRLKRG